MLLNVIESQPSLRALADAGDVAGLVAALNAKTIERRNAEKLAMGSIVAAYGPDFTKSTLGALKAAAATNPLLDATYIAVCSTGIDFSNPVVQATIDQLTTAGVWPAATGTKLKGLGIWQVSLAADQLGSDVTTEQVQAALAQRVRQSLYASVAERYNATIAELDAGRVNTLAAAKAFFGGA